MSSGKTTAADVFRHLYEHTRDRGYQPTMRDLAATFGFRSQGAITGYLDRLSRDGFIERRGYSVRFLKRPDGSPFAGFADKRS